MKNEMIITTVCYLRRNDSYLLLYRNKKKDDINKGKWIGVGGKKEVHETIDECAIREVKEETGFIVNSLKCHGEVLFIDEKSQIMMYVYEITDFTGAMITCDEGDLKWIPIAQIYGYPMWEGDKAFLPKLINHEPYFKMRITYCKNQLISVEHL